MFDKIKLNKIAKKCFINLVKDYGYSSYFTIHQLNKVLLRLKVKIKYQFLLYALFLNVSDYNKVSEYDYLTVRKNILIAYFNYNPKLYNKEDIDFKKLFNFNTSIAFHTPLDMNKDALWGGGNNAP